MATYTAVTNTGSSPLNVLDPNTWEGGVVPGAGDNAIFPHRVSTAYYYGPLDTINETETTYRNNALQPYSPASLNKQGVDLDWTGSTWPNGKPVIIRVASTTANSSHFTTPDSGSFFIFGDPFRDMVNNLIKIDYKDKDSNEFISCSIDHSYISWSNSTINSQEVNEKYPGDPDGFSALISSRYNSTYILTSPISGAIDRDFRPYMNEYELTGSGTWNVGRIGMGDYTRFTVKDNATLNLWNSTTTTNARIDFNWKSADYGVLRFLDNCTFKLTGSNTNTNTNNSFQGIYNSARTSNSLIISGSATYSSSFLASASNAGESIIYIEDSSSFGPGDYITIESTASLIRKGYVIGTSGSHINSGSFNNYAYGYSIYPGLIPVQKGVNYGGYPQYTFKSPVEEDELVRINNINGHEATITKMWGKEGEIHQDLGLYTFREFAEVFKESPTNFYQGKKRAVLVDSGHRDFQTGEKYVINDKVYTISYNTTYWSQSMFIDFTDPSTKATDVFQIDKYAFSGSGLDMSAANYEPRYRKWIYMSTASRGGVSSFYLLSGSASTPSNPATSEMSACYFISGSWCNKDCEVEVSASMVRDITGTVNNTTLFGYAVGWSPFTNKGGYTYNLVDNIQSSDQWGYGTPSPVYSSFMYAGTNYGYFLIKENGDQYGDYYNLTNNDASATYPDKDPGNFASQSIVNYQGLNPGSYSASAGFSMKTTFEDGTYKQYYNDTLIQEGLKELQGGGGIGIHLKYYSSLFSVNLKNRYQLLLLDTTDSFTKEDKMLEGGLLLTQKVGKKLKYLGNEIEDVMGYKNLLWDWYEKKGKTGIVPGIHSYIRSSNNLNNALVYCNDFYGAQVPFQYQGNTITAGWTNQQAGSGFYMTVDFNTPITFDTLAACFFDNATYGQPDNVNGYREEVEIKVSDNGTNEGSWETVKVEANDTRVDSYKPGIRFYTFPSGSVTKRWVRFYCGGGAGGAGTANYMSFFGAYNLTSGSGDYPLPVTNQIKLKDTRNLNVGDKIWIWPKNRGAKTMNADVRSPAYNFNILYTSLTNGNNGGWSDDGNPLSGSSGEAGSEDVIGGLYQYYTITNISSSVIQLNKPITDHISNGDVVYKLNRGGINFDAGRNNANKVYWVSHYGSCDVTHVNMWNCNSYSNNATILGGSASYYVFRSRVEDSFFYYRNIGSSTNYKMLYTPLYSRNLIATKMHGTGITTSNFYSGGTQSHFNLKNIFGGQYIYAAGLYNNKFNFCHNYEGNYYPHFLNNHNSYRTYNIGKVRYDNCYFGTSYYDPRTFYQIGQNLSQNIQNKYEVNNLYGRSCVWYRNTSMSNTTYYGDFNRKISQIPLKRLGDRVSNPGYVSSTYYGGLLYNGIRGYDNNAQYYSRGQFDYSPDQNLIKGKNHIEIFTYYAGYGLFKYNDYYSLYKLVEGLNPNTVNKAYGTGYSCTFDVLEDNTEVTIRFNMDYKLNPGKYLQIHNSSYSKTNRDRGYWYVNDKMPYTYLIDGETANVIDREFLEGKYYNFSNYSYDKTYTLNKGIYSFNLDWGIDYAVSYNSRNYKILDYKNLSMNVLSTSFDKLKVLNNTFTVHNLFNADQGNLQFQRTPDNTSYKNVSRRINTLPSSSIRFNNIKM